MKTIKIELNEMEVKCLKQILRRSGADTDDIEFFVSKLEEEND